MDKKPNANEMACAAWEVIRREHQPAYDDLEQSYKDGLIARAERVIADRIVFEGTDGVFAEFEREVLEQVVPERFHSDNPKAKAAAAPIPDDVKDELRNEPPLKRTAKVLKGEKK